MNLVNAFECKKLVELYNIKVQKEFDTSSYIQEASENLIYCAKNGENNVLFKKLMPYNSSLDNKQMLKVNTDIRKYLLDNGFDINIFDNESDLELVSW